MLALEVTMDVDGDRTVHVFPDAAEMAAAVEAWQETLSQIMFPDEEDDDGD